MPSVSDSVVVEASLAEVWDTYLDPRGWASWVDGFAQATSVGDDWPEAGSVLRWRSIPAGRGEVEERVTAHEERRRHAFDFRDPAMTGSVETTFAIDGPGTRVEQKMEYQLLDRGPISRIAALFFVKGQVRSSVQRSLGALAHEAQERAAADASGAGGDR